MAMKLRRFWCVLSLGFLATIITAHTAMALCGDVDANSVVNATDSLGILRAAVSLDGDIVCSCDDCPGALVSYAPGHCADVTTDAETTATDALAVLLRAVGAQNPFFCSCDACMDVSATTTTQAPPVCQLDELDGRVFNMKKRCVDSSCFHTHTADTIRFEYLGNGEYAVRRVADGTTLYVGTWDCSKFKSESFVWIFPTVSVFWGGRGLCTYTGAEAPTIPPTPSWGRVCP